MKDVVNSKLLLSEFNQKGFLTLRVLSGNNIKNLKSRILKKLIAISRKHNFFYKFNKLQLLEEYHKIDLTEKEHNLLMDSSHRFLELSLKEKKLFENKYFDTIFEYFYGNSRPIIKYPGKKNFINNLVGFRVVRPKEKSIAGFHSESSYGIHCFTLWVPLTGTDSRYTLKIMPQSHLVRHKEKFIIKNKKLNNAKIYKNKYISKLGSFARYDLNLGEGIFFHPDLIHGDSKNFGSKTRVSLEIRFYRKEFLNTAPQSREIKK